MKSASGETINPYTEYPQLPKSFLPLRLVSGASQGPCIVIGGGPSARRTIQQYGFASCFTIGVNHAAEHYPCDLVVCQDSQIFQYKAFRAVVENKRMFVVSGLSRPTSRLSTPKTSGYYYWSERTKGNLDWKESDPAHVLRSPSVLSGSQAVLIAHAIGFGPIVCIGFDANSVPGNYRYGFKHPKWGDSLAVTKSRQQMLNMQCAFLEENAVELNLVNCSDGKWRSKTRYEKVLDLVQTNSEENRALLEGVWLSNMMRSNPSASQIYQSKSVLRGSNKRGKR